MKTYFAIADAAPTVGSRCIVSAYERFNTAGAWDDVFISRINSVEKLTECSYKVTTQNSVYLVKVV